MIIGVISALPSLPDVPWVLLVFFDESELHRHKNTIWKGKTQDSGV